MIKPIIVSVCALILSLGNAQESCESLLAGLEQTLERTQSMVRDTKVKAGFIQVASVKSLAKQTPAGLEVVILEQTGPQPPEDAEAPEPESRFFEELDLSGALCVDHKLKAKSDTKFELELVESNDETPVQNYIMHFVLDGSNYLLEQLNARVKAPQMPVAMNMETTLSDWEFKD